MERDESPIVHQMQSLYYESLRRLTAHRRIWRLWGKGFSGLHAFSFLSTQYIAFHYGLFHTQTHEQADGLSQVCT